jgi:eukaryotic-like serine/threonine-protein kinase
VLGILARAIVVPSTALRTVTIGLVGAAVIVGSKLLRGAAGEAAIGGAIAAACWSCSAVAISALGSHTIFGLRREVQRTRVLGQYTLESKLGAGAMGAVWSASHAVLRRPTAVKLLPPGRMGERPFAASSARCS